MHICVCICSYQRPKMLRRTLESLRHQNTDGSFSYSLVVCDNDLAESGQTVVAALGSNFPVAIKYCMEPRRSIAHARNTALENATGEAIAFIDDDEFAEETWLLNLFRTMQQYNVAGVLGPVRPFFDTEPPAWIRKGRFCERPEHHTGFVMPWSECRTGNVLFRRAIISGMNPIFLPEFGAAGSDVDFFRRMVREGHKFIWCNEAVVHEVVPPTRWRRRFMLKRALLRGRMNSLRREGRIVGALKSSLAVSAYAIALPFLQLLGHHLFMKYLVKLCDHGGKLLGLLGLNPVHKREM